MRANSAAIQPRLRTIPRIVASRCASVHRGNASFKLHSAVLRSFGVSANNILARPSANVRAKERGNAPASLTTLDTTAYAIHSFIVGHYARSIDRLAVIVKIDGSGVIVKYASRLVRENQLSMTSQPSGEITATPAQRI